MYIIDSLICAYLTLK